MSATICPRTRGPAEKRMWTVYHAGSALKPDALMETGQGAGKTHPGAVGSLHEGMAETLTVLGLGVPPTLARTLRTLRSTNATRA